MKQSIKNILKQAIPRSLHPGCKKFYRKIWGRDIGWEEINSYYLFGRLQCLSIRKAPHHFRIHIFHIPIFFI